MQVKTQRPIKVAAVEVRDDLAVYAGKTDIPPSIVELLLIVLMAMQNWLPFRGSLCCVSQVASRISGTISLMLAGRSGQDSHKPTRGRPNLQKCFRNRT
jgi:hypothetical protein